jgi:large subunit ribosomal protein L4
VNLAVYDVAGKQVGSYELDPAELAPSVSRQLLHDAVIMYQANQRQGTQKTKTRGEVAGSTKKLYRQKGTGNARAGGRRSGTRRGGGHIFAKSPRDFGWRMPRKALQTATRMALASRLMDDEVKLVAALPAEAVGAAAPKTAVVARMLAALGVDAATVLVAPERHDATFWKSARNITGVSVTPVADLNAWSILAPRTIVMTTAAIDAFRAAAKAQTTTARQPARRATSRRAGAAAAGARSASAAKRSTAKKRKEG